MYFSSNGISFKSSAFMKKTLYSWSYSQFR